jgi:hypothetical protein
MKDLAELHAAAMELAREAQLPKREVEARLEQVRDPKYWESLSPAIEIGRRTSVEDVAVDPAAQADYHRFFNDERYFETPVLIAPSTLRHLNEVVDAVAAAGWPEEFALVSDAFWLCARVPAIRALVESRLGKGYRQIPHVWLHVVRKIDGAGGWQPHFDGFRPNRISVWLALTEATTTNGCMFLVPPKSLPESFRTLKIETLKTVHVIRAMHATRALPIPAGATVGWDFDVFHWGGRAVRPEFPRRAMSMEFLGPTETADPDEVPLVDPDGPLPSLDVRLKIIGIGLDTYSKRDPLSARFRAMADGLLNLA